MPKADGPLVKVTLHDGQHIYAVVKARVREPDGWWYDLQIHVPHQSSDRGRLLALPAAVDFRAPAALCEPIDGQPYDQVPTERPGTTPAWKVEEPVYFGTERGPARIVHRGTCHASRDLARPVTTEQARAALTRPDRRGVRGMPAGPAAAQCGVGPPGAVTPGSSPLRPCGASARGAPPPGAPRPLTWVSGPSATSDIELTASRASTAPVTLDVILTS